MLFLTDAVYLVVLLVIGPFWWLYRSLSRRPVAPLGDRLFGLPDLANRPASERVLWIHGVSVGEVLAARGLVLGLTGSTMVDRVVISTTTRAGFEVAVREYGERDVFHAPLDFSFVLRRVFRRIAPKALVLMELELWPNMLAVAKREGVPVIVANGKLSLKSARGYGRLMKIVPRFLDPIRFFCMQNEEYATRLSGLGVGVDRILVTGSLKADNLPAAPDATSRQLVRAEWGIGADEVVWMAGSTHEGEEEAVLQAWNELRDEVRGRLVLAPRHPDRVPSVLGSVEKAGLTWVKRSEISASSPREAVVVVDTMGELARLFSAADVVFLGGTLVPVGGHNILEPAAEARIVVLGPHSWTVRDAVQELVEVGGAMIVDDRSGLAEVVRPLLSDFAMRESGGHAARAVVDRHRGASKLTCQSIQTQITGADHD